MSKHTSASRYSVRLFYSYSHKDSRYRQRIEDSLSILRRNQLLKTWSDVSIVPGQPISAKIRKEIDRADIMVFLLSHSFLASDPCMDEWETAKTRSATDLLIRIPIVLSDCPWPDLLDGDDIKALPNDGDPIDQFDNQSKAWTQIYDGIKNTIVALRSTFRPKHEFVHGILRTPFVGRTPISLRDVFVFPTLLGYSSPKSPGDMAERTLTNHKDLFREKRVLLHGPELSGKSSLLKHLYASLLDESEPVLFIDLEELGSRSIRRVIPDAYRRQFSGDYELWEQQPDRTLIVDNLSSSAQSIAFLIDAEEHFERMIVACPSDVFHAFLADDERLVDFVSLSISPLTHAQQESLIRERMSFVTDGDSVTDGKIDHIENHVNSIITSKRIVPRYPFFVLSILQTYESFLPEMHVTSYGYCYHVLIVANLVKAGIPRTDDGIGTAFIFAERLAFALYESQRDDVPFHFQTFSRKYSEKYIIPDSILSRLQHPDYGIIFFRWSVSYGVYVLLFCGSASFP